MAFCRIIISLLLLVLVACESESDQKKNNQNLRTGTNKLVSLNGYPEMAANLSLVNSEYDDYNSAKPGEGERSVLMFSSNRDSKGKDFSIVHYNSIFFYYDFSSKELSVQLDAIYSPPMSAETKKMLQKINTSKNEYGPYIFDLKANDEFLMFYAQEDTVKLNLKFMANKMYTQIEHRRYLNEYGPYNLNLINDPKHNEAYISIQNHILYYCSDKIGNYDIYQHLIDSSVINASQYIEFLTRKPDNASVAIPKVNSESDDKCPYITNNFMVFSSNRKGGFGGYDLWYSEYINNEWTEPKNFGPKINSKYDEFRPIVSSNDEIPNDLMIFSSNRPGGKGGFDLYYVGIMETRK